MTVTVKLNSSIMHTAYFTVLVTVLEIAYFLEEINKLQQTVAFDIFIKLLLTSYDY